MSNEHYVVAAFLAGFFARQRKGEWRFDAPSGRTEERAIEAFDVYQTDWAPKPIALYAATPGQEPKA